MSCHPGPGCTGHTPGTTTTALPSPRAGPEPGSQGTQSRECRHGGSPSPTRVLSNPPHVDPPAAKVRRRVCDVSVRPVEVCTAGDQFSTQETKHCWNQGSALEMKKKGKTEALSSLPQGHVHSEHPEVNSHTDYVSPLRDLRGPHDGRVDFQNRNSSVFKSGEAASPPPKTRGTGGAHRQPRTEWAHRQAGRTHGARAGPAPACPD